MVLRSSEQSPNVKSLLKQLYDVSCSCTVSVPFKNINEKKKENVKSLTYMHWRSWTVVVWVSPVKIDPEVPRSEAHDHGSLINC